MTIYRRHVNEFLRTEFEGTGRLAGIGIVEEDYGEESFPGYSPWQDKKVRYWSRTRRSEPAPVVVYKLSENEMKKYRGENSSKT